MKIFGLILCGLVLANCSHSTGSSPLPAGEPNISALRLETVLPSAKSLSYPGIGESAPPKGTLYVATEGGIDVITPPYQHVRQVVPAATKQVESLSVSKSGDLFVVRPHDFLIYAPPYTSAPISIPGPYVLLPLVSNDGTLFLVGENSVRIFTKPYSSTPTRVLRLRSIFDVAVASSGTLIVVQSPPSLSGGGTITVYDPPYAQPSSRAVFPDEVMGLFLDASNRLFLSFALPNVSSHAPANEINEYSAPYTGTPVLSISKQLYYTGDGGAVPVAEDSLGDLFVLNGFQGNGPGELLYYSPPLTGSPTIVKTLWPGLLAIAPNNELFIDNCGTVCDPEGGHAGTGIYASSPPYKKQVRVTRVVGFFVVSSNATLFLNDNNRVMMFAPPYKKAVLVDRPMGEVYALAIQQ